MIAMASVPREWSGKPSDLAARSVPHPSPLDLSLFGASWRSLWRVLLVISMCTLALLGDPGAHAMPLRVYLAARADTFNLVEWEAHQLVAHASPIGTQLQRSPEIDPADLQMIREYLLTPRGARDESRWNAERAIERQLSALIDAQGIARLPQIPIPGLFPPVAFRFTSPPRV